MSRLLALLILCAWLAPAPAGPVVDARLTWSDRTELGTPLSGVVTDVLVKAGDRVNAGQPLVRLDRRAYIARREAARGALTAAREARAEAQRERDRIQELYDRTLLADHDLQAAQIEYSRAEAAYQRARADLAAAEQRLDEAELNAPFAARVVSVSVRGGQAVVNSMQAVPMVTVARSGRMQALAWLPAGQAGALKEGQAVRVSAGGRDFEGRILEVGLEPGGDEGLYPLRVEFAVDDSAGLRPGMAARLTLP